MNRSKIGKQNKRKGSYFETKIAKILSKEFNCHCFRTPCSGGIRLDFPSDVNCRGNEFLEKSFIECKFVKNFQLEKWIAESKEKIENELYLIIIYSHPNQEPEVYFEDLAEGKIEKMKLKEFVREYAKRNT